MSKLDILGKVGNDCEISNAHTIEIRKNYNGSGDDAFGGASEWPVVTARISFQVGEDRRAIDFAKKLSALVKTEFNEALRQK